MIGGLHRHRHVLDSARAGTAPPPPGGVASFRHRAAAAGRARLPPALEHLAGGEPEHVDERRGRGVDDDLADEHADLGGARPVGLDPAGVPAGPAERRPGRHPRPPPLARRDAVLAGADRRRAVRRHRRGADDRALAAGARLRQRHRPGAALAGVRRHRAGAGAAPTAGRGARAQRRGDEPVAHRRAARRRRADRQRRQRLGVRAQRRAVAALGVRDPALAPRARGQPARPGAAHQRHARRRAVRAPVGAHARGAVCGCRSSSSIRPP